MLLTGYKKNISRPKCSPKSTSLHCLADLNEDVSEALPYINATLGGYGYIRSPASVSFKMYGKLITVHARKICLNALKDEDEADNILKWLMKEINEAWENRAEIEPKFEDPPQPEIMRILRYLPKTNCRECGLPTCLVFASRAASGLKDAGGCPPLAGENKEALEGYLSGFTFKD